FLHQSPRPAATPAARRRPTTGTNAGTKSLANHRDSHHRNHRPGSPTAKSSLKLKTTLKDLATKVRQGSLRRRRDLARQRWPFGQHKMAVCLVAWTAVPESLRRFRWWSRPMISCRDEVSALTTTVAAQSVPRDANALWPGSDEDLRWRPSAFLACHFA